MSALLRRLHPVWRKVGTVQRTYFSKRQFADEAARDANLRYDGRVVLVTGAGGGLGKQYALSFAERGAAVVVNDLGVDTRGEGYAQSPAQKVVDEICSNGGKAVASFDSVEDGEKLIETALKNFGRIDIVVNNAGMLRDKTFTRISDEDWDLINRIHLRGSFKVTRAAWSHMKAQNYGKIIMTSSAAGIYGNYGQTNYSAAKLGLLGMSNTLSIEGRKSNISCNTIAPVAKSRLTEDLENVPKAVLEALKPELIAPLVLYLCHESCNESGGLFEAGGGWFTKVRWQSTRGRKLVDKKRPLSPEVIRDEWDKIIDFRDSVNRKSIEDVFKAIFLPDSAQKPSQQQEGGSDKIQRETALKFNPDPSSFKYSNRDSILYALGIGVSLEEPKSLNYLFEGADNFSAFPTFAVIPAQKALMMVMMGSVPGLPIDLTKLLHGEQYIELFKPIPSSGNLTSKFKIADVLDKGSGAVVLFNVETFDEKNEKVAFNQFSIFLIGSGNFGGPRNSEQIIPTAEPPSREPDATLSDIVSVNQAALYRQSGDLNPLHINPDFAALGGFKNPILHGLCTLGFAARHVLKEYADYDATKMKAIKVRFAKPVLPGQTLQTNMWKEGSRIHFICNVKETGESCLAGAYIDLITTSS